MITTIHCSNCGQCVEFEAEDAEPGLLVQCPSCASYVQLLPVATRATEFLPATDSARHPMLRESTLVDDPDVFLNEGGIKITRTRIVSGLEVFAMSGVVSVRFETITPSYSSFIWFLLIGSFGLLFSLMSIGALPTDMIVMGFLTSAAFLLGAFVEFRRLKPLHSAIITTAEGGQHFYRSTDQDLVLRVVNAINKAIISRG